MLSERRPLVSSLPEGAYAPNKLVWRPALGAALVAGLVAAVGTSIPIIPLAMLCMFASGGLAVTLYRRRGNFRVVTPWMGAKLGVLSGGMGFGLLSVLSTFRLFAASERAELRAAFNAKMQETIGVTPDPGVREVLEQFRGYIATDHGLILLMLFFLLVAAVFFLIFSALGGALGAAMFGRDTPSKQ